MRAEPRLSSEKKNKPIRIDVAVDLNLSIAIGFLTAFDFRNIRKDCQREESK